MYCKYCGVKLPENSKFCISCGKKIDDGVAPVEYYAQPIAAPEAPQVPEDFQVSEVYEAPEVYAAPVPPEPEPKEDSESNGCAWLFIISFVIVILIIIVAALSGGDGDLDETQKAASATVSTAAEVQKEAPPPEPPLTPREQEIRAVFEDNALYCIEKTIKKQLKNPDTAHFTHDKTSWKAHNAIFTGSGTTTYKNAKSNTVTEPFTVTVIMTTKSFFSLYVKLGDTISVNDVKGVNSLGLATKYGSSIFGVEQSNYIFGKDDVDLIAVYDKDSDKITLDEYNRIKSGMGYDEVTEIVGSYGTEMARSEIAGYQTFIVSWDGIGSLGANANVTFSSGKVYAKAQLGLQ